MPQAAKEVLQSTAQPSARPQIEMQNYIFFVG